MSGPEYVKIAPVEDVVDEDDTKSDDDSKPQVLAAGDAPVLDGPRVDDDDGFQVNADAAARAADMARMSVRKSGGSAAAAAAAARDEDESDDGFQVDTNAAAAAADYTRVPSARVPSARVPSRGPSRAASPSPKKGSPIKVSPVIGDKPTIHAGLLNSAYRQYVQGGRRDLSVIIGNLRDGIELLKDRKRPYTIPQVGKMIDKLSGGELKYGTAKPKTEDAIKLIQEWIDQVEGGKTFRIKSSKKEASPKKTVKKEKKERKAPPERRTPKKKEPKKEKGSDEPLTEEQKKRKLRKEKEVGAADAEIEKLERMNDKDRYYTIKKLLVPIEKKRGGTKLNTVLTSTFLDKFRAAFLPEEHSWSSKWTKDTKIAAINKWLSQGMKAQFSPNRKDATLEVLLLLVAPSEKDNKTKLFYRVVTIEIARENMNDLERIVRKEFKDLQRFKKIRGTKSDVLKAFKVDQVYVKNDVVE